MPTDSHRHTINSTAAAASDWINSSDFFGRSIASSSGRAFRATRVAPVLNVQENDGEPMKIFEIIHNHSSYVKPTLTSHPMVISNEMLGVEIELENVSGRLRSPYWVEKEDGSLRNNGREYVFRGPIGGADLFKALSEAGKHFREINPDASWRCSTHVHLDVRDMEVSKLKNLILLYVMYEEVLFKCSGFNRYKNNFGPAFGFAQQQILELSKAWYKSDSDFIFHLLERWSKYSSLNLLPISRFGSVEFRISNAMTTTSSLVRLCNRVLLIKEWALDWEGTHEELITHYASLDVHQLFNVKLTGINKEEFDQTFVSRGAILANDILHLENKRKESSQLSGMIVSNLSMSRLRSIQNMAEERRDQGEEWMELYEWATAAINESNFREITLERANSLVRLLGVSRAWVAHSDYTHLLNS